MWLYKRLCANLLTFVISLMPHSNPMNKNSIHFTDVKLRLSDFKFANVKQILLELGLRLGSVVLKAYPVFHCDILSFLLSDHLISS